MCFLSLQFSPRPEPPNRDIAVRSLPYPPPKAEYGKPCPEPPDRKLPFVLSRTRRRRRSRGSLVRNRRTGNCCSFSPVPAAEGGVGEALSGTAGRKHCCSFSPVPAAEAQSMGSVVRNRRTGNCRSFSPVPAAEAKSMGSVVRNHRSPSTAAGSAASNAAGTRE